MAFLCWWNKKREIPRNCMCIFYSVKLYYFFVVVILIIQFDEICTYNNTYTYVYIMWPMNRLHESVVYFHLLPTFIFQFYIYDELKLIVWIEYWNNYNCIFGERFMAFIVFRVPHSLTHNQLVGKLMEALWWLQKITWCQHFIFCFLFFFFIFLLGAGVEFSQINSLSFFFIYF